MEKLRTIWIDLTLSVKDGELPSGLREYCKVSHCDAARNLDEPIRRRSPDLICFDFDYPDRTGLRLLRETKVAHASIPILMWTVQHSESLAIWAFRNRVWDYLVKPVPEPELKRCMTALLRASEQRKAQSRRTVSTHSDRIPDEIAYAQKADVHVLAGAIFYVERHFRARIRSEEVATHCGLSPFRFSRLFKDTFGVTFREYLVNFRLREACRLLENPTVSVADVAFAVGFNDPSYFSRIFKQRIGTTPSLLLDVGLPAAQRAGERLSAQLPELLV
jgi:AraC-like DNA-binding protein